LPAQDTHTVESHYGCITSATAQRYLCSFAFDGCAPCASSSATRDAKDTMKDHREHQLAAQATGRAIRAILDQQQARRRGEIDEIVARRNEFYALLDVYRERLFSSIEEAVKRKERVFYPATIPGFASRCDKIFNIGIGAYSHDLLNAWLYANDLKHVFHADPGGVIRW